MHRILKLLACSLAAFICFVPGSARATAASGFAHPRHMQETGFLNRTMQFRGATHHFQVYLPEDYRVNDRRLWPIILFLHGRGERGSEGMWQTQIGLPAAIRDHPDRWPFIVVMPQCPQNHYWTDPDMLGLAMAALDQEASEFHGDPTHTYLAGLSLGGYGAWELARLHPKRWAAIAIASGGIFWSYAPLRWKQSATLPADYARALGRTPIWLFHGSDDPIVPEREDELMFQAFKTQDGHIRLWIYQGLKHDCWTRAFDEPDLPRWLLAHHRETHEELSSLAERVMIPLHPPALHLTPQQLESFAGDYVDDHGQPAITVFRQGDQLYQKDVHGQIHELAAESTSTLFYPNGGSISRVFAERDSEGHITALIYRDDRHEERWARR
ncbi:MAG: alpha/beta hydrolase-fold protein [Terracidiphilus sp.]